MSLTVKLHGVRGLLPAPYLPAQLKNQIHSILDSFCKSPHVSELDYKGFIDVLPIHTVGGFGGNTVCVEVESNQKKRVILDAGSGIRNIAINLNEPSVGSEFHIILTHFHWDHIIGLLAFAPLFTKGAIVNFYAVQPQLSEHIKQLFKKPYCAVDFANLNAKIIFHKLEPRQTTKINTFDVTPYKLDHPDECWGYKIQSNGKTYSHCLGTEANRVTREELAKDLPLYQNVDLMLFDGQYSSKKQQAVANGLDIAIREKVKKIIFSRHAPSSLDDEISEKFLNSFDNFISYMNEKNITNITLDWSVAIEGQEFEVK